MQLEELCATCSARPETSAHALQAALACCALLAVYTASPVHGQPVAGGGPLSGATKADLGLAPQPVAPKEEDCWLPESTLKNHGSELRINTTFDWSKVKAVSGGPIGANTPGTLERPYWLACPWQDLPFVEMTPFRGQSKPGGKNFALYQDWEARALSELQPLALTNMNGKKWSATFGDLGTPIRAPLAQASFTIAEDGTVRGTVWAAKRRQKPPPDVKDVKDYVYLQQIPVTGRLLGSTIRFDAAGLPGQLDLVGKGYGLKGEFAGKPVDSLISPLFQDAWKAVQTRVKKPIPVPTKSKTSYGADVVKWE